MNTTNENARARNPEPVPKDGQSYSPGNTPDGQNAHQRQFRTILEAMRRRTGLLVTAAGILVVWAAAAIGQSGGTTPTGTARPSEVRPLADRVQNYDRVNEEKSSWGSLRWLMNSKLDPGSGITLGVVELFAGESNPLHVHSNSDEVIYMLSGMGEHRVGRQTVILKAGDTLRIPAGTPHTAKALGKEPMRSVVVYNTGERQFTVVNENGAK